NINRATIMAILQDILYGVAIEQVLGSTSVEVEQIAFDSRKVFPNSLFVAIKGTQSDGHQYIHQVIESGANIIVLEILPQEIKENITYIKVANSAKALGVIAANFYDNPSSKLKLVGLTRTNGKTTVGTFLYKLFRELGYKVG